MASVRHFLLGLDWRRHERISTKDWTVKKGTEKT